MAGHEFHVHGPHDHALDDAALEASGATGQEHDHGHGHGGMVGRIAVSTAIIATIGVIFSFLGGAAQEEANLYKANVAIKMTEAAEQWNYYRSRSTKLLVVELAREIGPDDRKPAYQARVDRFEAELAGIKDAAAKLETDARQWDKQSEQMLRQHRRWSQATAVLQIAIAMAAIALLTRKKWIQHGMYALAATGLVVGALAALHV